MKKKQINSFWVSPPPLDDLTRIQEYLKPRSHAELLGFFAPPPPLPLSAEVRVEEPQQPTPLHDELMDIYGVTSEEFATSAINEPELWEEDELERLLGVLSGDLPPQAIADIAIEHMRTGGFRRPKPQPQVQQVIGDEDHELEELFPDHLETVHQPPPGPPIEVSGTIDVGTWWEKRKN